MAKKDGDRAAHERFFHREMQAAYERWQRGDVTAFSEAMRLCGRYERHPPDWLVDASKLLVESAMSEDDKRARRDWDIHRTRWEMVTELRLRGDELFQSRRAELERVRAALKVANDAQNTKERERLLNLLSELVEAGDDDRGTNLERARVTVSKSLAEAEDEAAGSVDAIKASYELIEDAGGEQHTFESFLEARQRRRRRRRKSKTG